MIRIMPAKPRFVCHRPTERPIRQSLRRGQRPRPTEERRRQAPAFARGYGEPGVRLPYNFVSLTGPTINKTDGNGRRFTYEN